MDWEFEVGRCKLFHLGWISNEALLYSTGNYIQFLGIDSDGRNYKKGYIYIFIYMYGCVYKDVCVCVCVYIHMHI